MAEDLVSSRRKVGILGHIGSTSDLEFYLSSNSEGVQLSLISGLARHNKLTLNLAKQFFEVPRSKVKIRTLENLKNICDIDLSKNNQILNCLIAKSLQDADPLVNVYGLIALSDLVEQEYSTSGGCIQFADFVKVVCDLVDNASDYRVREAGVATLGVFGLTGEYSGLDTVISHAANDKPKVRRRAVLALATYTGSNVEKALIMAAQDKDWQTRQAAEDLLKD